MSARTLLSAIALVWPMVLAAPAIAQTTTYTKLNIKGRVQLEVPSDWTISDGQDRTRVRELAEKLGVFPELHTASFAAQSYPAPSRTMVRVSFIPLDPPLSQTEMRQAIQTNGPQLLKSMADEWHAESPMMWAALAKQGIQEVGKSAVAFEAIGGQTALVISYGRTTRASTAEWMKVTQYHVVLGPEKALITLSHIEGDEQAIAVRNQLKSSIVIR